MRRRRRRRTSRSRRTAGPTVKTGNLQTQWQHEKEEEEAERGRQSQAKSHVRCSAGAERIGSKSNAVASRCICRDSRLKLPLRRTHINFYGRRK